MVNAVNDINTTKNNMGGGTPLISVIIPVYNGEKFISETVNNIFKSTYRNIEVLLINDGSKDNSAEICRELVESDERVKYFYKENGGIASARNFGIENAKGEYVAFSDQDDLCKTDIYECLLKDLLSSGSDFVISNYATFTNNINEIKINDLIKGNAALNKDDIYEIQKYLLFHTILNVPKLRVPEMVWNCLFSAKFLKTNKIKFIRFVDYEDDWLFLLQCLQCADKVYLEKEYFYCWRIHEKSESHTAKYIDNIYNKLVSLTNYLESYIQKTTFTDEEKINYMSFRGARNIMQACVQEIRKVKDYKSYKSAKRYCKSVAKQEKQRIKNKNIYREYGNYYGKRLQLYLHFLSHGWIFPVFVLEKYI